MMMMEDPPAAVAELEVLMPRLPPSAADAAFSVVHMDREDIEGNTRLDQALSQAPGVSLFRRTDSLAANPTTQGISLRSIAPSGAGRALVTLDGVPQNDPFGGWVIWAGLPSQLIDNVTLVRGGGAGPYGAGALTGVIALQERARDGYEIDAQAGENSSQRGALIVEQALGGLDVLVSATGGKTDGYVPVFIGAGAADTALAENDWSASARVVGTVGSSRLAVRVGAFYEDRESGLAGASARATGQSASVTLGQAPTSSSVGYRLQAWARTSDLSNSSVSVAAPRAVTTPANNQYKTPATGYGLNGALRGGDPNAQWEVGGDVRSASGETREQFTFTTGSFRNNRIAGGDSLVAGIYGEGTRKIGDWLLTGGARVDYWRSTNAKRIETVIATGVETLNSSAQDKSGVMPSGRVGLRRDFGSTFLRGAAYTSFRQASLNELHRPFRVGNINTLANPLLKPEQLKGIEAGAGFTGENGGVEVTWFYNELTNAITNVTIAVNTRQRQNAGTIKAYGIEAEGTYRFAPNFAGHTAITYTDAETDAKLKPAQAPELTATASLTWKPIPALSARADVRYEGARFDDDLNTVKLGAATVLDARLGWTVGGGVEVYVLGDNVLNAKVENGQTSGPFNYAAPRVVSVGLTFRR
ncbi:TonB-dependent receptor [soil metagenome]